MKDTIYTRRSCRTYGPNPISDPQRQEIEAFGKTLTPLYPEIKTEFRIVDKEQVRFFMPWKTPQLIAVFSENKPGFLENVGFLFQQMDLYLQSKGLGVCWMGLGKLKKELEAPEGMEFVILLPFGTPKEPLSKEERNFPRREPGQISDREDTRLECARVAPSSTNSQPWYFTHEDEKIHAFCSSAGILRHAMLGTMNKIDMGIALAHLYVENRETFRFFREETEAPEGFAYTGTFTI